MIDSHAHLDDEKFDLDREELINNLKENGIDRVYNIGADIISSENSVNLANKYDNIFAVVGVHPHEADSYDEKIEKRLEELAKNEKVVGIGQFTKASSKTSLQKANRFGCKIKTSNYNSFKRCP